MLIPDNTTNDFEKLDSVGFLTRRVDLKMTDEFNMVGIWSSSLELSIKFKTSNT
jgi:hypothetical protein